MPLPQSERKSPIAKKPNEPINRMSTSTTLLPPTTRPPKTSTVPKKTRGTRPPKIQ